MAVITNYITDNTMAVITSQISLQITQW
jgi:hypothetical protein